MLKYLTCYDYGQGGVWLYVEAESPSAIEATYRDLIVFETPPPFWTDELEKATQAHQSTDPFWQEWLQKLKR